jgi:hypothetical protein
MPAFGPSQPEEKLWRIAAFVKRLAGMSAKDYRSLGSAGG